MIFYKKGYKYQLSADYFHRLSFQCPPKFIDTKYIKLNSESSLLIADGYAWDGPSGPAIDTNNFMRGSLVHDALYQLIRNQYLDYDPYRKFADEELRKICLEDGMSKIRAWWVYRAVRDFGGPAARGHRAYLSAP